MEEETAVRGSRKRQGGREQVWRIGRERGRGRQRGKQGGQAETEQYTDRKQSKRHKGGEQAETDKETRTRWWRWWKLENNCTA